MTQPAAIEIPSAIKTQAQGILTDEELSGLYQKIAAHPTLTSASAEHLEYAVSDALNLHEATYHTLPEAERAAYRASFVRDGVTVVDKAYQNVRTKAEAAEAGLPVKKADAFARPKVENYTDPMLEERLHVNQLSGRAGKAAGGRSNHWKQLTTEHTIYGGMSLMIAAVCAMGAASSFKHSVNTDAQGNRKVEWSQVGMGIISAALAAGSVYAGVQTFRGR
jgi:hypothetical protein